MCRSVLRRTMRQQTMPKVPVLSALSRTRTPSAAGPSKAGVVARDVILLPRHWDWLDGQPGGAFRRSGGLWRMLDMSLSPLIGLGAHAGRRIGSWRPLPAIIHTFREEPVHYASLFRPVSIPDLQCLQSCSSRVVRPLSSCLGRPTIGRIMGMTVGGCVTITHPDQYEHRPATHRGLGIQ